MVEPVQGDVEPVASLVLQHGDLHRGAFTDRDRLDAAIDADPVFQMHDEASGLEGVYPCWAQCLPVPFRPPEPARAPKDLVIGEH